MSNFLPSRKVIAFVLVPAVTLVALFLILNLEFSTDPAQKQGLRLEQTLAEGRSAVRQKDTDGDGLRDWEETLYGTDLDMADTDGDGTPDGDEVRSGRDPLSDADDDVVVDTAVEVDGNESVYYKEDPNLTRTDILARDIFTTYSQLRSSEGLGTDVAERYINDTINENITLEDSVMVTVSDIQVMASTMPNKTRYRNQYQNIANTYLETVIYDDVELLARYVELGDREALDILITQAASYKSFARALAKITVPQDISEVHLDMINNFGALAFTVEQMTLVEADPLSALLYAEKYIDDEESAVISSQALTLYFNDY
jgi:hypothetical protein